MCCIQQFLKFIYYKFTLEEYIYTNFEEITPPDLGKNLYVTTDDFEHDFEIL